MIVQHPSPSYIGEFLRIAHGFAFKGEYFCETGTRIVLTPGNFHESGGFRARPGKDRYYTADFPERYLLDSDDLIVAMTEQGEGLLGSAALVPKGTDCLHNQRIGLVTVDPALGDKRFFYYLLNSQAVRRQVRNSSSGTKVRHTSPERMYQATAWVPKIGDQKKIASILSAYDDLIENNRRRIALLERMAEELYREWFVRFRFPGNQGEIFKQGVPLGWDTNTASVFFGYSRGKSYNSDELSDDPLHMPFITLKSFNRGGGFRADSPKWFSGPHKANQVVRGNDVIMAVTDMTQGREVVGRVARVPDLGTNGAVISMDVIKLVPKTISASFLYSYMRLSGFGEFIKEFANGTNVLHLKPDIVVQQKVTMPPESLRDRFTSVVEPMFDQIDALNISCALLERSRNLLLPRLISGKLRVDDLDIQFPPSMQPQDA